MMSGAVRLVDELRRWSSVHAFRTRRDSHREPMPSGAGLGMYACVCPENSSPKGECWCTCYHHEDFV